MTRWWTSRALELATDPGLIEQIEGLIGELEGA